MCSLIQEVDEEPPSKYEPNKEQRKHEDFKWIKEVSSIHPCIYIYIYHQKITEDFSSNKNVRQGGASPRNHESAYTSQ